MNYSEFSIDEQKLFREWLRGVLQTNIVKITFIKKDGSERIMNATLIENKIAKIKGTELSNDSDNLIKVTDVDINEWRAIKFNSIKEIHFSL